MPAAKKKKINAKLTSNYTVINVEGKDKKKHIIAVNCPYGNPDKTYEEAARLAYRSFGKRRVYPRVAPTLHQSENAGNG